LGRTPLAACPPTTGRQRGDGARVDPPAAPDERDGVAACAASTAPTVASITAVSAATASLGIARVRSPVAGQPPGAACAPGCAGRAGAAISAGAGPQLRGDDADRA